MLSNVMATDHTRLVSTYHVATANTELNVYFILIYGYHIGQHSTTHYNSSTQALYLFTAETPSTKKHGVGIFLVVLWLRIYLSMQETQV